VINIVFSLSVAGISIGAHLGGVIGGAICGWLMVELGEKRRQPAVVVAACLLVAVVSVIGAIAVASGTRLTPNGITI
jgi:sugar phosphate permease